PVGFEDVNGFAQSRGTNPELAEHGLLRRQHIAFFQAAGQDVLAQPRRHDLGDPRLADPRQCRPDHQSPPRRFPNLNGESLSGEVADALNSPVQRTSSSSSSRAVDVIAASISDRTMSKRSSVRMGVGRRYVTDSDRVRPESATAQLWCWMTQ